MEKTCSCACTCGSRPSVADVNNDPVTYTQDEVLDLMSKTLYAHHIINLDSNAVMVGGGGTEVWGQKDLEETRAHASGWCITGKLTWDYYCFCSTFRASHIKFGDVWSNNLMEEKCMMATSKEAMEHFWEYHGESFEVFDLDDI